MHILKPFFSGQKRSRMKTRLTSHNWCNACRGITTSTLRLFKRRMGMREGILSKTDQWWTGAPAWHTVCRVAGLITKATNDCSCNIHNKNELQNIPRIFENTAGTVSTLTTIAGASELDLRRSSRNIIFCNEINIIDDRNSYFSPKLKHHTEGRKWFPFRWRPDRSEMQGKGWSGE